MATEQNRISSKNIVDAAPIVVSDNNPELFFYNPKNIIVKKAGQLTFDKYLGGSPFGVLESDLLDGTDAEDLSKDTVHLTDIESITFEQYNLPDGTRKVRAILKIRNSSKTKEDVIGVDARIANLQSQYE